MEVDTERAMLEREAERLAHEDGVGLQTQGRGVASPGKALGAHWPRTIHSGV